MDIPLYRAAQLYLPPEVLLSLQIYFMQRLRASIMCSLFCCNISTKLTAMYVLTVPLSSMQAGFPISDRQIKNSQLDLCTVSF